jgi:SAM-dependent methyltransferase
VLSSFIKIPSAAKRFVNCGSISSESRQHYEIEKLLADQLRNATRDERRILYNELYEELFRRVPNHPQLKKRLSADDRRKRILFQMRNIQPFLRKNVTLLEVGAGDCALSSEAAKYVNQVYALDVTDRNFPAAAAAPNIKFVLSDGCSIPVEHNSIDVVYSYQLMEHLHPDDAFEQLRNIRDVIKSGGVYLCDTPNRLSGPHDISRRFDKTARGFHLKEYTVTELRKLFLSVGFSAVKVHVRVKALHMHLPVLIPAMLECFIAKLPDPFRRGIARLWPLRLLLGIRLVGTK